MIKKFSILLLMVFLSGCGNSEIKAVKRDFMSGCQEGASKKVCSCAFDEWRSGYAEDDFIRLSSGQGMLISLDGKSREEQLSDFLDNGIQAVLNCARK